MAADPVISDAGRNGTSKSRSPSRWKNRWKKEHLTAEGYEAGGGGGGDLFTGIGLREVELHADLNREVHDHARGEDEQRD
jgi:hypothetical protein